MSPILGHFPLTNSKKAPENRSFLHFLLWQMRKAPVLGLFSCQAAPGPVFSVRSVMRADLPVRPRR
jgi:hypothetical protein